MSKYGIPYKGNKSKIAEDILNQLPSGKRLVDLFGGALQSLIAPSETFQTNGKVSTITTITRFSSR